MVVVNLDLRMFIVFMTSLVCDSLAVPDNLPRPEDSLVIVGVVVIQVAVSPLILRL